MNCMPRVQAILNCAQFKECMTAIATAEKNRQFCRHDLSHALDVARAAWIYCLERELQLDKEVVYAAALLHDIGRAEEYTTGEPHDVAGVRIAEHIFTSCPESYAFNEQERTSILAAIGAHRNDEAVEDSLARVIQEADHSVRLCFACKAYSDCYWTEDRKNHELVI